jgi:hypothetical protein
MPPSVDVLIKDAPSDTGAEPFTGTPFWESPDIAVRQTDDDVFIDEPAIQGQKNFVYVRVHNRGKETANDVTVSLRAVAFPGSEFLYPQDWTAVDGTHVKPTGVTPHFNHLPPGATEVAKFRIDKDDVDILYGWEQVNWHPCLLAEVTSDEDPTAGGFAVHVWDRNNLAQRNITVIPKVQPFIKRIPRAALYAFIAGHRANVEPYMELVIDRSAVPRSVELFLDPAARESVFPALSDDDLGRGGRATAKVLDSTRLGLSFCGSAGIVTLAPGSFFEWSDGGCAEAVPLVGAEVVKRDGRRLIALRAGKAVIGVPKAPGELRQMSLAMAMPDGLHVAQPLTVRVAQRNIRGRVVGGVTLLLEGA